MKVLGFVFIFLSFSSWSQKEKPMNYRRFDEKTFHFGFLLGASRCDYTVYEVPQVYEQFGVTDLYGAWRPGGQVGPVVTMNLGTPIVRLRFSPSFSFQERALIYSFANDSAIGRTFHEETIESANLDFPLTLQFRTIRVNNFAAYALTGFQYSVDLQSNQNASQVSSNPFIKTNRSDWQGQVGAGVEFFFPYFKFGMELKYSQGIQNVLIQDGTTISKPIDQLYNRVWSFSLIFEG